MTTLLRAPEQNQAITIEAALTEFRAGLLDIANAVLRTAKAIEDLERLGYDTSALPEQGIVNSLRRLNAGQILPEIATRYITRPMLFKKLTALPLGDQKKIAKSWAVAIPVRTDDGWTDRMVSLDNITPKEINLAFNCESLRTQEAMIRILEEQAKPADDPYDASEVIAEIRVSIGLTKKQKREFDKRMKSNPGQISEAVKKAISKLVGA